MEENNQKEQENKTPSKMARLAWPKAKYGVIIAIIIIVVVNLSVSYTHLTLPTITEV